MTKEMPGVEQKARRKKKPTASTVRSPQFVIGLGRVEIDV